MPTFTAQLPDGRTASATGDTAPSEAEWDEIFKSVTSQQPSPSSVANTVGQTAAAIVPAIRAGAEELATNPKAWKAGKVAGEIVGGATGMVKGGPLGAAGGMWVGGKAGWRLTNAAQRVAVPVAKILSVIEPYTLPLSAMSAEGSALERLNSPEGIAALAKAMNPTVRQKLLTHFKDQPEYVDAIKKAIGSK